jgi:hypothetical protein
MNDDDNDDDDNDDDDDNNNEPKTLSKPWRPIQFSSSFEGLWPSPALFLLP